MDFLAKRLPFHFRLIKNLKKKPSFTEINTYDLFSESNKKMPVTMKGFQFRPNL